MIHATPFCRQCCGRCFYRNTIVGLPIFFVTLPTKLTPLQHELLRSHHCHHHLFGDWSIPPYRHQERILFWSTLLVGIRTCWYSIHRGKSAGRKRHAESDTWCSGLFVFLEHSRTVSSEKTGRKGLVSDEPQTPKRLQNSQRIGIIATPLVGNIRQNITLIGTSLPFILLQYQSNITKPAQ